jgi:DNA-binding NtrC family response regulator
VASLISERPESTAGPAAALLQSVGIMWRVRVNIIGEGLVEEARRVRKFAELELPVLISGATGTGKELLAWAYAEEYCARNGLKPIETHYHVLNCSHLTEQLFRSELFGHVKGAFTDAVKDRKGLISRYEVICLDELSAAPRGVFPQLLRLVENGQYTPLGADEEPHSWGGRLIACTNNPDAVPRDLKERFHELTLPLLVDRPGDIVDIIERKASEKDIRWFTDSFVPWAADYEWPGNVRELLKMIDEAQLSDGVLDIPWEVFKRETGGQYPHPLRARTGAVDVKFFRDAFWRAWRKGKHAARGRPLVGPEFEQALISQYKRQEGAKAEYEAALDELRYIARSRAAGHGSSSTGERQEMEEQLRRAGSVTALAELKGIRRRTLSDKLRRMGIHASDVLRGNRKRRVKSAPTGRIGG